MRTNARADDELGADHDDKHSGYMVSDLGGKGGNAGRADGDEDVMCMSR